MDDNMILLIDPETRDLVFDNEGHFRKIFGADTTVQNVRHALLTWKAEFFADLTHGTEYERIVGMNQNEVDNGDVEAVIREAILQETDVARIDELTAAYDGRSVTVGFSATLTNGETMTSEVKA